jgi:hypothetical protein
MTIHGKRTILRGGLVLTVLVFCLWYWQRAAPLPRLAVTFTGLWHNPTTEPKGFRIQPNGGQGLCAVFAVTNLSKDTAIWFDTAFVEQKTEAGWKRVKPGSWSAIDSSAMDSFGKGVWPASFGCYYTLTWPPGIPTNGVWRLGMRCGRNRSAIAEKIAKATEALNLSFLSRRKAEQILLTPEVKQ